MAVVDSIVVTVMATAIRITGQIRTAGSVTTNSRRR